MVVAEPNAETIANFAKWMQKENVKSKVNLEPFSGAGYGGVANVELKVIFNNPISFVNYQTYLFPNSKMTQFWRYLILLLFQTIILKHKVF